MARSKKPVPIRWGARIDGEVYGTGDAPWDQDAWDTFEVHTGKRVGFLHWGQPFGILDLNACKIVRQRRATSLISIGLEGATLPEIVAGQHDARIRSFADTAAAFGDPLIVRPWWEMNGTWYVWGRSPDYVAAWQHFYSLARSIAPNLRFCWCPNAIWDDASDPTPWYPGHEYVDWIGFDAYNRNEPWKSPSQVFDATLFKLLGFVKPGAPVMICETGCEEPGGSKAGWINAFLGNWLPGHSRVRAFCWFNWNITEGGKTRQWQIESSSEAQSAFRRGISSSYFL